VKFSALPALEFLAVLAADEVDDHAVALGEARSTGR